MASFLILPAVLEVWTGRWLLGRLLRPRWGFRLVEGRWKVENPTWRTYKDFGGRMDSNNTSRCHVWVIQHSPTNCACPELWREHHWCIISPLSVLCYGKIFLGIRLWQTGVGVAVNENYYCPFIQSFIHLLMPYHLLTLALLSWLRCWGLCDEQGSSLQL